MATGSRASGLPAMRLLPLPRRTRPTLEVDENLKDGGSPSQIGWAEKAGSTV
jgi:hypothetical protein